MKNLLVAFALLAGLTSYAQTDISAQALAQTEEITFTSDGWTLNGTLTIPDGNGPHPAMVLVHGSGANDRDQTLALTAGNTACLFPGLVGDTIRSLRDIAEGLTARGIAVLRYDKRSFTHGPQLDPITISPYDFITDVHSALDYLGTRAEIDPNCLMVLGHSQGGNFAPMVARERTDVAAVICMGTPAWGIDTIIARQTYDIIADCQGDTALASSQSAQTLTDFLSIRNGTWPANQPYLGVFPIFWNDWINMTDSAVWYMDAAPQPTLILAASNDFNVPLEHAAKFDAQLTRTNVQISHLNGLNHYFTPANDPLVAEAVFDTIMQWLAPIKPALSVDESSTIRVTTRQVGHQLLVSSPKQLNAVTLYNLQGQVAHQWRSTATTCSLSTDQLAPGLYILDAQQGSETIRKKLLIAQ